MNWRTLENLLVHWLAGRRWRCCILRRCDHVHAEITNLVQAQPCQWRNRFCHLPKHIFDRAETIAASKLLKEIAQDLPILARLAGGSDSPIQSLQTAATIDHRAAFFGVSGGGQDRSGVSGGGIAQNIHGDERGQLLQRSEEHTSELQSRFDLVCRLLLEKKKKKNIIQKIY